MGTRKIIKKLQKFKKWILCIFEKRYCYYIQLPDDAVAEFMLIKSPFIIKKGDYVRPLYDSDEDTELRTQDIEVKDIVFSFDKNGNYIETTLFSE